MNYRKTIAMRRFPRVNFANKELIQPPNLNGLSPTGAGLIFGAGGALGSELLGAMVHASHPNVVSPLIHLVAPAVGFGTGFGIGYLGAKDAREQKKAELTWASQNNLTPVTNAWGNIIGYKKA